MNDDLWFSSEHDGSGQQAYLTIQLMLTALQSSQKHAVTGVTLQEWNRALLVKTLAMPTVTISH